MESKPIEEENKSEELDPVHDIKVAMEELKIDYKKKDFVI